MTTTDPRQLASRPNRATTPDLQFVAPGVWALRIVFVNAFFIREQPNSGPWILVDAGLAGSAGKLRHAAESLFGPGAKPAAVLLTHGHFDHAGALHTLLEEWDVPIYAHPLELPYLTGRSSYPPPDPTVGGGAMALMSVLYPKSPYDFGSRVQPLPADGSVPGFGQWRWLHTPGHTPGHVSFFREADRVLLVGDAFTTVKQESAMAVWEQRQEMHGPPMYFTCDWHQARQSVQLLAALKPEVAATGHGIPMRGPVLREELELLARHFDEEAVPAHGRYVPQPAIADETGVVSVPPPVVNTRTTWLLGATALAVGIAAVAVSQRRHLSGRYSGSRRSKPKGGKARAAQHDDLAVDPFVPVPEPYYSPEGKL